MASRGRALALTARGALAGAIGGAGAGALDFVLSAARVAAFLPTGRVRLLLFLCVAYAAAAALLGALVGLVAEALGWATDLGSLWRHAFSPASSSAAASAAGTPSPPAAAPSTLSSTAAVPRVASGARLIAYALALALVAVGYGVLIRALALDSFRFFHHRDLIAALIGGAAAALVLPAAALVFVLAAALSPLVPFGPRLRARLAIRPTAAAVAWSLGLLAAAGAVALFVQWLELHPRMTPDIRALNVGLWSPALTLGALVLAHLSARVARRIRPLVAPTPVFALLAVVLVFGLALALVSTAWWSTVRQLDRRPFVAAGTALLLALATAVRAHDFARFRPLARGVFAVLLIALLSFATFRLGRTDRVRKAAMAQSGLAAPIVRALQLAIDFDRDGYSPVFGGGDCDDFDRDVHPGAFDWPDDGIDQDCNGHQATLAPRRPRAWAEVPAHVPEAPSVVLFTIDALRADHVGSYGYARPTTPNLDALARESVRFANGWAHAPSTRYSVPAILIGRYPSTIAVNNDPRVHWPPQVLPENRLISEILKDRGYRTSAFLSYHYFEPGWGLNQGFDDYDYHLYPLHSVGGDPAATRGSSARQLADLDVDYIAKHSGERFFLWTHYYDTHFLFERHPDAPETDFGPNEIDLYDGEIRYTDLQIGRVLDALKKAGLWEKTIIVVTSDHGDGFGEHGLPPSQRHGYHLYRNETKVPILIRVPGIAPRVVDEPVGHVDLLPTVLNALRAPKDAEPQLLGDSVLGLMLGQHEPARRVFQEVWYEGPTSRKAVVTHDWHLIRNLVPDDTVELYDELRDPAEERDRAGDGEPAEAELGKGLAAWMDEIALPSDFATRVAGNVSRAPIPSKQPLGDRLGDFITLEGIDAPPAAAPGRPLEFSLILHGTAALPEGWHLFMHVRGPNGQFVNADHEPLAGAYPLERLRAGVWLKDVVKVDLPANWPPGPLTVDVGLWRRGERAPARGPHASIDSVRVATVTVTPAAPGNAP